MAKTSMKIIENNMNKELELCSSKSLYDKEVERICTKYTDNDKKKIEKYAETLLQKNDDELESYRTGINNLNFSIIAVLDRLNVSLTAPTKTVDIYSMDMEDTSKTIETHVTYIDKINSKKIKELTAERKVLIDTKGDKKKIESLSRTIDNLQPKKIKDKKKVFAGTGVDYRPKRDSIEKALKFLSVYNVITQVPPNSYKLNMEHWFNFQRYSLNNRKIFKDLLPLLAAFLKYNAPNKVDNFLNHIDKIVGHTLKAPKNHASFANIENFIIEKLNDKNDDDDPKISFKVLDSNNDKNLDGKTSFIDVNELQIIFDENGTKILKFKDGKNYQIPIEDIYLILVPDKTENSLDTKTNDGFVIYNDLYADKIQDPKHKEKVKSRIDSGDTNYTSKHYFTVFEANSNMIDFFDMNVLRKTEIYKQEQEKEEFISKELNGILDTDKTLDDYKSKFFVTGEGTADDILDYVQRNQKDVKLLHPPFLILRLKEILRECDLKYEVR